MDKRLTKAARDSILSDTTLFKQVADKLKVKPASLSPIVHRNATKLNSYDVVVMIAEYMGKPPSEILEEEQAVPAG